MTKKMMSMVGLFALIATLAACNGANDTEGSGGAGGSGGSTTSTTSTGNGTGGGQVGNCPPSGQIACPTEIKVCVPNTQVVCSNAVVCGNGDCQGPTESTMTCPADCGTSCGDTVCNGDESPVNCPADCSSAVVCGNGDCQGPTESTMTCPADCGTSCGDTVCNGGESPVNCPTDCGKCGNAVCDQGETILNCPVDCGVCGNGSCEVGEHCSTCSSDCGPCPGACNNNGVCDGLETVQSCPADCGNVIVCGNGQCQAGETCSNCPGDCGVCNLGTMDLFFHWKTDGQYKVTDTVTLKGEINGVAFQDCEMSLETAIDAPNPEYVCWKGSVPIGAHIMAWITTSNGAFSPAIEFYPFSMWGQDLGSICNTKPGKPNDCEVDQVAGTFFITKNTMFSGNNLPFELKWNGAKDQLNNPLPWLRNAHAIVAN